MIGDEVTVTVELVLARFFDSVKVQYGSFWDSTVVVSSAEQNVIMTFTAALDATGEIAVVTRAFRQDRRVIERSTLIDVAGFPPSAMLVPSGRVDVNEGQPVAFSVDVSGTPPFTYQWFRSGSRVSTDSAYTISSAASQNAGAIYCIVASAWGRDTSDSAVLTVYSAGTPPAPAGLEISSHSGAFITLIWLPVDSADGYRVYRDSEPYGSTTAAAQVTATRYNDEIVSEYYYWVTAVRNGKESPPIRRKTTPSIAGRTMLPGPRSRPRSSWTATARSARVSRCYLTARRWSPVKASMPR